MLPLIRIVGTTGILALLLCSTAAAQNSFQIDGPTTVTNGGQTLDGADVITVTPSGSVTTNTPVGIGLFGNGDANRLINNGTVTTTANGAHGLSAQGSDNTATNTGTVTTGGDGTHGLFGNGNTNSLTNSGRIETGGAGAFGLYAQGNTNALTNSSTVVTAADGAHGLFANGSSNTLRNSGTATTAGAGAFGLYAQGDSNALTNSGTVSTTANGTHGLFANGGSNALTNSGTVETDGTGAFGLYTQGDTNTLTNSGRIDTDADGAHGLFANGGSSTLRNSGTVETGGSGAFGLYAQGRANTLSNSGTIATAAAGANGLFANGDSNTLSNAGTVRTTGAGAHGVYAQGASNRLTNTGAITTTGAGTYGLFATGGSNALTNNGTIVTSGNGAIGFFVNGDGNTLTNAGRVTTSGAGAHGVVVNGLNASLTNSGRILSANGQSIRFTGDSQSQLRLLQGSVLQGDVHFDDPATASLTLGPGLNAVIRTDGSVPASITGPDVGFVVNGNTVYAVDPGFVNAADRAVGDVGGLLLDALDAHLSDQRHGRPDDSAAPAGAAAWVRGFGRYRAQDRTGTTAPEDGASMGFMLGRDLDGGRGVFVGIARTRDDSSGGFDVSSNQLFGGYYASFTMGSVATDAALTLGTTWSASERTVANNTVAGGLETASTAFNGHFIMPSVTFSGDLAVAQGSLTPSARLRYVAIHQDGFAETGSASNLSLESRTSHLLAARFQLDRGLEPVSLGSGTLVSNMRLGVDLQYLDGDIRRARLTGPAVDVVLPSQDGGTSRGFVGLDLQHRVEGGRGDLRGGIELGRSTGAAKDMRATLHWVLRY